MKPSAPENNDEILDNETKQITETPTDDTTAALLENLKVMVEERDAAREAQMRAMADLQNFRRRAEQERDQLRALATQGLVMQLLPVLDNFERTILALDNGATIDSIMEGVRGIDKQLRSALEGVQLSRIESSGAPFDPEIHEAIGMDENSELPENTVTIEIEAGYKMGKQIIRPAKVKVSKKP